MSWIMCKSKKNNFFKKLNISQAFSLLFEYSLLRMIVTAGLSVIKSDACAQSQSGLKVSFHKYYNLIAVLHAVRILYDNKSVHLSAL